MNNRDQIYQDITALFAATDANPQDSEEILQIAVEHGFMYAKAVSVADAERILGSEVFDTDIVVLAVYAEPSVYGLRPFIGAIEYDDEYTLTIENHTESGLLSDCLQSLSDALDIGRAYERAVGYNPLHEPLALGARPLSRVNVFGLLMEYRDATSE